MREQERKDSLTEPKIFDISNSNEENPYTSWMSRVSCQFIELILHDRRNRSAKAADLQMVDRGIPFFPFLNNPSKKGEKHSTTYTLQKYSPSPGPCPPCGCIPKKPVANAARCTRRTVVPGTKNGDSSNSNSLPSLPPSLD
ncbi:hypothetical protein WN943_011089 [Citrus x changshan-huyou]